MAKLVPKFLFGICLLLHAIIFSRICTFRWHTFSGTIKLPTSAKIATVQARLNLILTRMMGERLGLALALERRPTVLPSPQNLIGTGAPSVLQADPQAATFSLSQWTDDLPKYALDRNHLNRIVLNYLISEGHKEAAERFVQEAGLATPVNLDILADCVSLRQLVVDGKVLDAIVLLNDLSPMLLEENRYLLFKLQQQYVIELIREKRLDEALVYAQNFLSERVNEEAHVLPELEKTLTLLAFDDPCLAPFAELMSVEHRQEVASESVQALLSARGWSSAGDSGEATIEGILHLASWCQDDLTRTGLRTPVISDIESAKLAMPGTESNLFGSGQVQHQ